MTHTELARFLPDLDRMDIVTDFLGKLSVHQVAGGPWILWLGPQIGHYLPMRGLVRAGCETVPRLRPGQAEIFVQLDHAIRMRLRQRHAAPGITYLSLVDMMRFDPARDIVSCDTLYWIDGHHWSRSGMMRFAPRLAPLADQLKPRLRKDASHE